MANPNTNKFLKFDDYMTPKYAWENIKNFIPNDKVIWEAFYGDGKSGDYLKELGFNVIHEKVDFFENDLGDLVVSNPPFSQAHNILKRLKELNKPFILILPCSKLNTQYMRSLFAGDEKLQIIIPKSRISFNKQIDGKTPENFKNACNFDCFYYCWQMNLPTNLVWL